MRHYEILLLIHPDQSNQINAMLDRYGSIVTKNSGIIHRKEDWGKIQLAYQINKLYKAHYILLNIECSKEVIAELSNNFKFNDAIIRSLITKCDQPITDPSVFIRNRENEKTTSKESNGFNVVEQDIINKPLMQQVDLESNNENTLDPNLEPSDDVVE